MIWLKCLQLFKITRILLFLIINYSLTMLFQCFHWKQVSWKTFRHHSLGSQKCGQQSGEEGTESSCPRDKSNFTCNVKLYKREEESWQAKAKAILKREKIYKSQLQVKKRCGEELFLIRTRLDKNQYRKKIIKIKTC